MASKFVMNSVAVLRRDLDRHPVYAGVRTLDDLRTWA